MSNSVKADDFTEATIGDLTIAASMTEPGELMEIPRVRVVELLAEIKRLRGMVSPAVDVDEVTAAIAAADIEWGLELGDPPSEPRYIQALGAGAMRAIGRANGDTCPTPMHHPLTNCPTCHPAA